MHNNVLTSKEVKEIIDNLYDTIGVRMNINLSKYPAVNKSSNVSKSSFLDDCKIITDHLELPIYIIPTFSSSFETKGVVRNTGNGTSGIGAQIHIPSNLPWYKTDAMKEFPINVTIPPEALSLSHFFLMTQLSHEFSHIYLHSRRDPQKESEWATDLCALMMGFAPLWFRGRKRMWTENNITYTETQGYLSKDEYDFAVTYIDQLRKPFEQLRNKISTSKQKIQSLCDDISKYLEDVVLLYDFHFKHPQNSFKHPDDAVVFSKLAQSHYKTDIENLLKDSKRDVNAIIKPLSVKQEFYEKDKKGLEDNDKVMRAIEEKLRQRFMELKHDYEIIIQNIDVKYHTKIHSSRIKSLSKGIHNANKIIKEYNKKLNILDIGLKYYKQYKMESYARETDEKNLSLISHADYFAGSKAFIKKEQEKLDEIDDIRKKAHKFYSIADDILESEIAELNSVVSTLDYCLKELKSHIKVVMRNLKLMGKVRWMLNNVFIFHKPQKS